MTSPYILAIGNVDIPNGNMETVDPVARRLFTSLGTDGDATMRAWALLVGSAPTLTAHVAAFPSGCQMAVGHLDWWDLIATVRVQWATGAQPFLYARAPIAGPNWVRAYIDGANLVLQKDVAGAPSTVATTAAAAVNGTWYWLRVAIVGALYTVTLYADTAGAMGASIATISGVIADAALQGGRVGLEAGGTPTTNFGGAFAGVCTISGPSPLGWIAQVTAGEPAFCWSKSRSYSGKASASVYNADASGQGLWIAGSGVLAVPLPAGSYQLSGQFWGSGAPSAFGAALGALWAGGTSSSAWQRGTQTGAVTLSDLFLFAYGQGTYYFDDIHVINTATIVAPKSAGIEIDNQVAARTTALFEAIVPVTTTFSKGQPVSLRDGNDALVFGGRIDTPKRSRFDRPGGKALWSLQCVDDHYLADKIVVAKSWAGQTCGFMVNDLLASYLAAEGIVAGNIEAGPVVTQQVSSYIPCSQAIDELATLAGFTWWIFDSRLYFQSYLSTAAPWGLTGADLLWIPSPVRDDAAPLYRNRQWVKGFKDVSALATETQHGDNIAKAFVLGFPVAMQPTSIAELRASYSALILKDAPVGYWRLGDASGALADSSSVATHPGTLSGTLTTYAQPGAIVGDANLSFKFALGTGRIDMADATDLKPAALSAEFWVKPNSLAAKQTPMAKASSGAWSDGWGFYWNAVDGFRFFINNYTSFFAIIPAALVTLGGWHHIVGTYDPAAGLIKVYFDGVLAGSVAYTPAISQLGGALTIGNNAGSGTSSVDGPIDEAAFYNYALSPQQVAAHYATGYYGLAGAATYPALVQHDGPVGYWRLGEASGQAADSSGNAHPSTVATAISYSQPGALANNADTGMGFNGTTSVLSIPDTPVLKVIGNLALEFWIKPASMAVRQSPISKGYTAEFELTIEVDGSVSFYFGDGATYAALGAVLPIGSILNGVWAHVVVQRDAVNGYGYLNGVLVKTIPYSHAIVAGAGVVAIGAESPSGQAINGELDEVAVYAHALSAAQVAAHYAVGKAPLALGAQKTFGIKGVDTGKDYYWAKGDPSIVQDQAGPVLLLPDSIAVTYQGLFDGITQSQDTSAVDALRTIEGIGTGYVDNVIDLPGAASHQAALDQAGKLLSLYAKLGNKLTFTTLRSGLQPGQLLLVTLTDLGYTSGTDNLLIVGVKITDSTALMPDRITPQLIYEVTAVEGPYNGDWALFFAGLITTLPVSGSGLSQMLTILNSFTEAWAWSETVTNTVHACFAADGLTVADGTHLAC